MKVNIKEQRKEKNKMAKKITTYLIDIIIIIAILAIGLYGFRLISKKAEVKTSGKSNKSTKIQLTVEFEKHYKELLEKIEVGQEVIDSSRSEPFGTIISETPVEDCVITVSDYINGKFVKTSTPEYGMKTVVIECDGTVTDTSVTAAGKEVRIGTDLLIRTSEYTVNGKIMAIDFKEDKENKK